MYIYAVWLPWKQAPTLVHLLNEPVLFSHSQILGCGIDVLTHVGGCSTFLMVITATIDQCEGRQDGWEEIGL